MNFIFTTLLIVLIFQWIQEWVHLIDSKKNLLFIKSNKNILV